MCPLIRIGMLGVIKCSLATLRVREGGRGCHRNLEAIFRNLEIIKVDILRSVLRIIKADISSKKVCTDIVKIIKGVTYFTSSLFEHQNRYQD